MNRSTTMLSFLPALILAFSTACTGKPSAKAAEDRTETAANGQNSPSGQPGEENDNGGKAAKKQEKKNMEVKELTTQGFKDKVMNYELHPQEWVFEGDKPAIIDFYATWCGPCKATAPIVADIAKAYDGKIDVYKVDIDQQEELAAVFGIRSIPTIFFIPKNGNPQVQVGAMNRAQFDEAVKEILLPE